MKQVVIKVGTKANDAYQVTLDDGSGQPPVSGTTSSADFENGLDRFTMASGAKLTAALLQERYSASGSLSEPTLCGSYLYHLLAPGEVGVRWKELREAHKRTEELTTLLEMADEEWRVLPWELIHDEKSLFLDINLPIGHRMPGGSEECAAFEWPLRMLVIVGADPDGNIKSEEELIALRRAVCDFNLKLDLTVLGEPGSPKLTREIIQKEYNKRRPHIVHYMGHGITDGEDGHGALLLEGPAGRIEWSLSDIRLDLEIEAKPGVPSERPRLAFINACQSAEEAGDLGKAAVAAAFSDVPVVIAMRADIRGEAASTLAEYFYRNIAVTGIDRPDLAYARAIAAVQRVYGSESREWSLTRIFYQHSVGAVKPRVGSCTGFNDELDQYLDLKNLKPFVDREADRFDLYHRVDGWLFDKSPGKSVLLVHGDSQVGKSRLLQACAYIAQLRGIKTFYWDFSDPAHDLNSYGYMDVIKVLRNGRTEGTESNYFGRPLVDPAEGGDNPFAEFDALFGGAGGHHGGEDAPANWVPALARGIEAIARKEPVLIALDHLDKIVPGVWDEHFHRPLVRAAGRGGLGGARLAITSNGLDRDVFDALPHLPLEVRAMPGDRYEDLHLEYILHYGDLDFEMARMIMAAKAKGLRGNSSGAIESWKPGSLRKTVEWMKAP